MANFRGYTFPVAGDPKPWGSVEESNRYDLIRDITGDSLGTTYQSGGHQHNGLYGSYGNKAIFVDSSLRVGFQSPPVTYDVELTKTANVETRINIKNLTDGTNVAPRAVFQGYGSNSLMVGCASPTFFAESEWQGKAFVSSGGEALVLAAD